MSDYLEDLMNADEVEITSEGFIVPIGTNKPGEGGVRPPSLRTFY